jgi:histidinol-phosphate aminotransferase
LRENVAKIRTTRERLASQLEEIGFSVVPSQANFVWCTHPEQSAKTLYEQLKRSRILVRYMDYPGWGAGLRISVGTDEQIDALLTLLSTMV